MIGFRTTQNAQLRKTASRAAPSLAMVPSGTVFVGDDDVDGMIKTQIIALSPEVGFINSAHAVEVDVEPEPIQAEGILIFCRIVTKVARDLGLEGPNSLPNIVALWSRRSVILAAEIKRRVNMGTAS